MHQCVFICVRNNGIQLLDTPLGTPATRASTVKMMSITNILLIVVFIHAYYAYIEHLIVPYLFFVHCQLCDFAICLTYEWIVFVNHEVGEHAINH